MKQPALPHIDTTLVPLSERMRPQSMEQFFGQCHLLGKGKLLRHVIDNRELYSLILWGPPGSGKTTLARIIAETSHARFISLSAVTAGIKDIRAVMGKAAPDLENQGIQTILFIDEIHRFNKAQQDALLPHVEKGHIVLIGATTENPSFEVIAPLLSRTKVMVLKPLPDTELSNIMSRALNDKEHGLGSLNINAENGALDYISAYAQGDARVALNTLELAAMLSVPDESDQRTISRQTVEEALQKKMLRYDK
ncbi:MAG: AAA family ATPase, partial [Deltaproteobacteria bacterium]|nr:AAA family ATPase [Deltaproteobacteria bacterium]